MFNILFQHNGVKYVKFCNTVQKKENFTKKLDAAGIKYDIVGDVKPQLCGCVFKANGTVYTYVRAEGDAAPGNSGKVDVVDENGKTHEEEVVLLCVREATIEECRQKAAELGRKKLGRLKRVWQRTA